MVLRSGRSGGAATGGQGCFITLARALSALGSGRACPTAVIAFCPSCQSLARPQCDS